MNEKIGVVIVLYYSEEFNFECLLGQQNLSIILVDNTPKRNLKITSLGVDYIPLNDNYGIAAAQNIGIERAKELACSYILFFDQDSIISVDYISQMLLEYTRLKQYYPNIAVLGPTVIDKISGRKYKTKPFSKENGCEIVPAIVSSGSVFETNIFDRIGKMDEKLFIDNVDDEWGWRATYNGFTCCITTRVKLLHKIGQKNFKLLGIPFIISSPFRYYYQYRNYLWLLRRSYVPFDWKCRSFVRKLVEVIVVPCASKNKYQVLKNIFRGICAGFLSE